MQSMLPPNYANSLNTMDFHMKMAPPTARVVGDVMQMRCFTKVAADTGSSAPSSYADMRYMQLRPSGFAYGDSNSPTTAASFSPMARVADSSPAGSGSGLAGAVGGRWLDGERSSVSPSARCLEPAGDLFDDESTDDGICDGAGDFKAAPQFAAGAASTPAGAYSGGFLGRGGIPSRTAPFATGAGGFLAPGGVQPRTAPVQSSGACPDSRTTIMLQRIASNLEESAVSEILDRKGLAGTFTAVYVPRNRKKDTNLAYAFVDFALPEHAELCMRLCEGVPFGDTTRICSAAYSKSQGKAFVASRMTTELSKRQATSSPKVEEPKPESAWWEQAQSPWVCRPPPGLSLSGPMCF